MQLYSWDILTALFPVLCILTKQHGIRGGKYLLKTSGNTFPRLYFSKCLYNICLVPQELVPLVRVTKPPTIHYQLVTSKLFDSPVCWIVICPQDNAIQCLNKKGLGEEKVVQIFLSKETIPY